MGLPDPRDPTGELGINVTNEDGIWVNRKGKRFTDERGGPTVTMPQLLAQPGGSYFMIIDQRMRSLFHSGSAEFHDLPRLLRTLVDENSAVKTGATLADLARAIGMPPAALEETVATYNRQVAVLDDPFGRFDKGRPLPGNRRAGGFGEGPYHALQLFPLTRKSLGGVQVDAEARVRDAAGKSIPGLWAVGEVTGFGGLNGRAALEGTFIGLSILMGRVAGRALAKQHGGRPIPVRPLMLPSSTSISPSSGAAASSNGTCRASDATP